jgi:hypothetical protein
MISPKQRHSLNNIQHSQKKNPCYPTGFEPAIAASERPTMNIFRLLEIIVHFEFRPLYMRKVGKCDIMEMLQVAKKGKSEDYGKIYVYNISGKKASKLTKYYHIYSHFR